MHLRRDLNHVRLTVDDLDNGPDDVQVGVDGEAGNGGVEKEIGHGAEDEDKEDEVQN